MSDKLLIKSLPVFFQRVTDQSAPVQQGCRRLTAALEARLHVADDHTHRAGSYV